MPPIAGVVLLTAIIIPAYFCILMYIDNHTVYVRPGKFNFANGNSDKTIDAAVAYHQENKSEGEFSIEASVTGDGKAEATAQVGHEFEYLAEYKRPCVVGIEFEYKTNLRADTSPVQAKTLLTIGVAGNQFKVLDDSLTASGHKSAKHFKGKKDEPMKRRFNVVFHQGQRFVIALEAQAIADTTGTPSTEGCRAEIVASVKEIWFRPKLLFGLL
jgi:hypothetical protein